MWLSWKLNRRVKAMKSCLFTSETIGSPIQSPPPRLLFQPSSVPFSSIVSWNEYSLWGLSVRQVPHLILFYGTRLLVWYSSVRIKLGLRHTSSLFLFFFFRKKLLQLEYIYVFVLFMMYTPRHIEVSFEFNLFKVQTSRRSTESLRLVETLETGRDYWGNRPGFIKGIYYIVSFIRIFFWYFVNVLFCTTRFHSFYWVTS